MPPNYSQQIGLHARLPSLLAETSTWCYVQSFLINLCVYFPINCPKKFGVYVDILFSLVYLEVGKLYLLYATDFKT